MLRKRISRWTSRSDDAQQPFCTFTECFWQHYIETLGTNTSAGYSDITAPNPTKYSAMSGPVVQLKNSFADNPLRPSTSQIIAALKSPFSQGDVVKAYHLIRFFQLSDQGFFITNDGFDRLGCPIELQGAENWEHVMCYLDALLFSMFANLESFEPILFLSNQHPNALVNELSGLLRVYVNLMRSGNLITTDITQKVCECLYKLGFSEALSHKQQDCAPLFEFLTETLAMPLLTFRVEIQHSGKHDSDDTKYSKERILFVSIPEETYIPEKNILEEEIISEEANSPEEKNGEKTTENITKTDSYEPILLEECLEHYFNNSISVKRELQRRATLESQRMTGAVSMRRGSTSLRNSSSISNLDMERDHNSSTALTFTKPTGPTHNQVHVRTRSSTLSVWSITSVDSKPGEVMLPAWMLLRLLPFYTDDNELNNANESIAKNTREFADRRPVLPICLKRYYFSSNNKVGTRSKRKIVIPPVIDLPSFVADDACSVKENNGNFKLILESAVCHRGNSTESGHFVSVVRKNAHVENETLDESLEASWFLYDDLGTPRVKTKTFKDIFETEWPYLLFYRLVPSDSIEVSFNSGSTSPDTLSTSPIIAPKGCSSTYWPEDTLSPIISFTEDLIDNSQASYDMPAVEKATLSHNLSNTKSVESASVLAANVPVPKIFLNNADFIDIRKKYLWYITDKDKNYYKESASVSKSGSRNLSISFTPQCKRNSQWSGTSNISQNSPDTEDRVKNGPQAEQYVESEEDGLNITHSESATSLKKPREHKHHLHHIFSHDKEVPSSLSESHVKKKHFEYKKEKCVIT